MQKDKKEAFVSANTKAEEMQNASLTKCIVSQNIRGNKREKGKEVDRWQTIQTTTKS